MSGRRTEASLTGADSCPVEHSRFGTIEKCPWCDVRRCPANMPDHIARHHDIHDHFSPRDAMKLHRAPDPAIDSTRRIIADGTRGMERGR